MSSGESIAGGKSGDAFLSLRRLTKRYGDFLAVDSMNLDVPRGELVAFLGPSGCGKTTSLRMIAGLTPQSEGRSKPGTSTTMVFFEVFDPNVCSRRSVVTQSATRRGPLPRHVATHLLLRDAGWKAARSCLC